MAAPKIQLGKVINTQNAEKLNGKTHVQISKRNEGVEGYSPITV
jgi:hypothetical protein